MKRQLMRSPGILILMCAFTLMIHHANAQQEEDLFYRNGVKLTWSFEWERSANNNAGRLIMQWRLKFNLINGSGSSIRLTSPINISWNNEEPLPSGWSGGNSSSLNFPSSSTIKPGDTFTQEAIVYTGDITGNNFKNSINLRAPSTGYWTEVETYGKSTDTFEEHRKRARSYESAGQYESALREWQFALEKNPYDSEAKRKVGELTNKTRSNRVNNYQAMNVDDQKQRTKQEQKDQADFFGLVMQGAGIFYKGVGNDNDNNKYQGGGTRLTFSTGYSFSVLPIYDNTQSETYNGTTYSYSYYSSSATVTTLNLGAGLEFWPYYGDNAGISLLVDGLGGFMPLAGSNYSYQYNFGSQAFAGLPNIKLTAKYLMGDRGMDRDWILSTSYGKSIIHAEGAAKFQRLMMGVRFTFSPDTHPSQHLEVFYITETYPNMKQIKSNGVNITYSTDNRLRIYADCMFNAARIGRIENELQSDVKNTGFMLNFGVIRTMDWFH